jgi:hypothetical protein
MKYKILCACAVFAFAVAVTPAQTKETSAGKCAKPDVAQTIPAGDKDGHAFMVQSGKCATTSTLEGVKSKEGAFAEHDEATGTKMKGGGVYVETFENGDKIYYSYSNTGTTKDNMLVTGSNMYTILWGTGKFKGMKGSGTCKTTGRADGGLDYSCMGTYTMGAAAAPKKP